MDNPEPYIIEKKETDKENEIEEIIKPEGIYSILYGVHILPTDPNLLPQNVSAVFLETGMIKWEDYSMDSLNYLRNHRQYKEIFEQMEKKKITLLLGDVNYRFSWLIPFLDIAVLQAEASMGMKLLKNSLATFNKNEKLSKKDIAKIMGGSAAGLWLLLPMLPDLVRAVSVLTNAGLKKSATLQKAVYKLHPELFLLLKTIREAVIAEKEQKLMEHIGNRPHFATIMGGAHTGLEDQILATREERLKTLQRLKPVIKLLVVPESFYQLAQWNFNGNEWELTRIYNLPELREVVEE